MKIIFLSLFAVLLCLTVNAQYYTEENGVLLWYSVLSEDEKTVEVSGAPEDYFVYNEQTGENEYFHQDISQITRINVPGTINGYTVVRANGFMGLPALEEITFAEGVKELGERTLEGCIKLEIINLPQSLEQINKDCFNFCTSLAEITLPENLYRFGDSWGNAAFLGCQNLKKLNILCKDPQWILTMTNMTYSNSDGEVLPEYTNLRETVESIYFGPNVGEFSEHFPFPNLKSITVDEANTELDSRNGCNAVIWTPGNKLIKACNTTQVPSSVEIIGHNAFEGTTISELNLPPSVKEIGGYAFANCNMLTEVTLYREDGMYIGNNTFDNCQNLKKISFGPRSILQTPVSNCPSLEEITFGENWSLYDKIFENCLNIRLVTLGETYFGKNTNLWYNSSDNPSLLRRDMVVRSFITEPQAMELMVEEVYDSESGTSEFIYPQKLYVPKGTKALYEQTETWNKCAEIIEMEDETGIEGLCRSCVNAKSQILNLSGQRLITPQKGINIINGEKFLVK